MRSRLVTIVLAAAFLRAADARAACVNKFTVRTEASRHIITMLTGKLTFMGARTLAMAIREGKAAPLEWFDERGKSIAKQFGPLRVIRPMSAGCDGNSSGVIMIAAFPSGQVPGKTMIIRLQGNDRVVFEQQE